MKIAPEERPRVKAECLRLAIQFRSKLEPRKLRTISKFVDGHLRLNEAETRIYEQHIQNRDPKEKSQMRKISTTCVGPIAATGRSGRDGPDLESLWRSFPAAR